MTAQAPDVSAGRIRLRKLFLRGLVTSLTSCALIAVGVLLFGEFNETTGRILGTLLALAVHSGIAMFCADTLERQRWPMLSRIGLAAFAANFVVLIIAIWWPGGPDVEALRAMATTGVLAAAYVVAIPCADLYERGLRRFWSLPGLVTCTLGCAMAVTCIWGEDADAIWFGKLTAVVCIVAFTFAQMCILVGIRGSVLLERLFILTAICAWIVAALLAILIVWEIEDDLLLRVLGAGGVLDACGSLSLLILAKLQQVGKRETLQTVAARVELRCPRCTMEQTVDAGASTCTSCGLKFRIEVEEPRCAHCDYLLWQLPERRCPECGTEF